MSQAPLFIWNEFDIRHSSWGSVREGDQWEGVQDSDRRDVWLLLIYL